jgi:hypothetical protein
MKYESVQKAKTRLERLRMATRTVKESKNPAEIEVAWEGVVMAAGSAYSILEQGAKGNGQSEGWFGRKKHERRNDELLSYVHHARNAEEHGFRRITDRTSSHITLESKGSSVKLTSDGKNWIASDIKGDVKFANDVVLLVRVHDDRFGDWFDPPTSHLGKKLDDPVTPAVVAELTLTYVERLIAEAEGLVPKR